MRGAFISGLPDGTHTFSVTALDANGNVLATGSQTQQVVVAHWPLGLAIALCATGAIVTMAMIGLLIWGHQLNTTGPADER